MTIRTTIAHQMQSIAVEQNKSLSPLTDDLLLLECGLDSLCFAILVARLEDDLGCDPFATEEDVSFPSTFGEFVHFYEHAAA